MAGKTTKAELVEEAQAQGVEVQKGDTKADIEEKLAQPPAVTQPHPGHHGQTIVGNVQRRSGEDAILGSWVDVIDGEHAGRFGSFFDVSSSAKDGVPEIALVRTRDARNEVLEVPYEHLRPSERSGGR